jgi:DNA-binding beta-propeller fold protein YncE
MKLTAGSLILSGLAASAGAQDFAPNHLLVVGHDTATLLESAEDGSAFAEKNFGSAGGRYGAAIGPDGRLYVANWDTDRVEIFAPNGQKQGEIGAGTALISPFFVAIGPNGNVYVSANGIDSVLEYTVSGSFVRFIGIADGLTEPSGLCFGPDGHLFVGSVNKDSIFEFDADGAKVRQISVGATVDVPYGVTFGLDGSLYVASSATDRIVKIAPVGATGVLQGQIGAGSALDGPIDVVIGPNGHVLVTSFFRDSIFEFLPDGTFVAEHAVVSDVGSPAPTGLVVAPFRLKAKLTGTVARQGVATHTIKDKGAILSVSPGSRCVMLSLVDDPASTSDLVDELEQDVLAFRGWETTKDAVATKRWIHGASAPNEAAWSPVGSLALQLTGKAGPGGTFGVKSALGTLHVAAAGVIVSAKVTTAGLVK